MKTYIFFKFRGLPKILGKWMGSFDDVKCDVKFENVCNRLIFEIFCSKRLSKIKCVILLSYWNYPAEFYLFKVSNRNSVFCLHCKLSINLTYCSGVSIADFQQVNASWVIYLNLSFFMICC